MEIILIAAAVSLILLISGFFQWRKSTRLLREGITIEATVTDNISKQSKQDGLFYYPVIEYNINGGEVIKKELRRGFAKPKPAGSKIKMIYETSSPDKVEIYENFSLKVQPWLFIFIGLSGLTISILMYTEVIHIFDF